MHLSTRLLCFLALGVLASGTSLRTQAQELTPTTYSFQKTLAVLTNTDREARGVSPLALSPLLSKAAQKKADEMAAQGYFSHYSPNGTSPWYWFTSVGYRYTSAGENLAVNFNTPHALEAAWMNSPTHRANIVRSIYTQTGIGIAHGTYLGKPATFVVQLFATPAPIKTKQPSPLVGKTR